jgi:hypothetical protein
VGERVIKVCDECGSDLPEGTGAVVRLNYVNRARGGKNADLCDRCAERFPGQPRKARRSKKPVAGAGASTTSAPAEG